MLIALNFHLDIDLESYDYLVQGANSHEVHSIPVRYKYKLYCMHISKRWYEHLQKSVCPNNQAT